MPRLLSFRFALMSGLGLVHACGAHSTDETATTNSLGGESNPRTGGESPSKQDPDHDSGAPANPGTSGTTTIDVGTEKALLTDVCPQPETVSELAPGLFTCANGLVHRPEPHVCPLPPSDEPDLNVMASAGANDFSQCTRNADCNAAANGRCVVNGSSDGGYWTGCEYPCANDDECGETGLCECGPNGGNCVAAGCGSDADCDVGHACTRFVYEDWCGPRTYYQCTTSADECWTEADCDALGDPSMTGCWPNAESGKPAVCQPSTCVEGRPFLVAGQARTAPCIERSDWMSASRAELDGLDAKQRLTLAEHWTEIAQMEHASIAAFARFALQLLAVGAPAHLLSASAAAMTDETHHAQLAFGLVARYGGSTLGPGALQSQDALNEFDLVSVARGTLLEGCIGETLAALDAEMALEQCADPEVASVLRVIARDEARHAELAWKFVQWAIATRPELAEQLLELATQQRAAHRAMPAPLQDAASGWRRRCGVTTRAEQHALRGQVLDQIVLPCLHALVRKPKASRGESSQPSA